MAYKYAKLIAWMVFCAFLASVGSCTLVSVRRHNVELEKAKIENETRLERTQEHLKYVPWYKKGAVNGEINE